MISTAVIDSFLSILKAAHLNSFSSGSLKAKMFIIQMNNKITDAAEVTDAQKIRYVIFLL